MSPWIFAGIISLLATIWSPNELKGYMYIAATILILTGVVEHYMNKLIELITRIYEDGK